VNTGTFYLLSLQGRELLEPILRSVSNKTSIIKEKVV